jgi:hypothetical protein
MQVDDLYPEHCKRNYRNFFDGFVKTAQEGALFRGAIANGLKVAMIATPMTCLFDYLKESSYWFLGPSIYNRIWPTLLVAYVATVASLPFDTIKTRLHTMKALPNGEMPYEGIFDCYYKVIRKLIFQIHRYEANQNKNANVSAFYAGAQSSFFRLVGICLVSQFLLDSYHNGHYKKEYWTPAKFSFQGGIDLDIHDPWTMAFHKGVASYVQEGSKLTQTGHPDNKPINFA